MSLYYVKSESISPVQAVTSYSNNRYKTTLRGYRSSDMIHNLTSFHSETPRPGGQRRRASLAYIVSLYKFLKVRRKQETEKH